MESDKMAITWQLECELDDLDGALRQFLPSIRATRFHNRKAWFRASGGLLIIEIDRGRVELAATGDWPGTVAILCRDLFVLSKGILRRKGVAWIGFRDAKLRISSPGLKWMCSAALDVLPTSFISRMNAPQMHRNASDGAMGRISSVRTYPSQEHAISIK